MIACGPAEACSNALLLRMEQAFGLWLAGIVDWCQIILAFVLVATALWIQARKVLGQRRGGQRFSKLAALSLISAIALLSGRAAHSDDKPYRPPRVHNGQPDLQGIWNLSNATPLSRLEGFETLVISAEQAAAIDKIVRGLLVESKGPNDPDNELADRRVEPIRGQWRSSLVVDPPDGRLPGTPAFHTWSATITPNLFGAMDGPEQRPPPERCIVGSSQPPIMPNPSMNLYKLMQTDDAVVLHAEAISDTRIIRLNAKHAPAAVTSWLGDSVGWWEGDTLVVETKHFAPSDPGRAAPFASYRLSPQATVIERFTRVSQTQLDYSFTVEDPVYYTRPWSGETQLMRSQDRLFEYACHEGNYALAYILQAARVKDGTGQREHGKGEGR